MAPPTTLEELPVPMALGALPLLELPLGITTAASLWPLWFPTGEGEETAAPMAEVEPEVEEEGSIACSLCCGELETSLSAPVASGADMWG